MDQNKNLESKYERLRKIGIGSYGVVFKCVDRRTGQIVAIKRYSENDTDPIIRKIAMREVRMLRQLRHPNLIHLIEVFRRKRRLHLVFNYCELTVLDVIEKYENNCPVNLIKKIIWQLVNGVNYCHSHNCIHRDIKPENILINQSGVVKLCDFGFARAIPRNNGTEDDSNGNSNNNGNSNKPDANAAQNSPITDPQSAMQNGDIYGKENVSPKVTNQNDRPTMTEYVATRWYRSPELLVGDVYYTTKIDIWAIGCVTAELMRGEPVWPGKTDFEQLCMISSSSGPLTSNQMQTLLTKRIYDQASIERLLSQSSSIAASLSGTANPTDPIERKLPSRVGQLGIEFVLSCLHMDPQQRPTSEELLHHAYIHSARMAQFIKDATIYSEKDSKIIGASRTTAPQVESTVATHSATTIRPTNIPLSLQRTNPTLKSNSQSLMRLANHNDHNPNNQVSAIPTSMNRQSIYSNVNQVRFQSKVPVTGPKIGKKEAKYSASVAAASSGNQMTGSPQTTAQVRYKKRKRDSLLLDKTKATQDSSRVR